MTLSRLRRSHERRLTIERDDIPVTALIDDAHVTLRLEGGLGTAKTWSGRIGGNALEFTYQADDGSLQTLRFERAAVGEFNKVVQRLQEQVSAADDAADEAEAQEAAAEQQAQFAQQVADAGDAIHLRLADVRDRAADLAPIAAEVDAALSGVRTAVKSVEKALAAARAAAAGDVCYEAGKVDYEAGRAEYELGRVEYYRDRLTGSRAALGNEIATAEQVWEAYENLAGGLSGTFGGRAPTKDDVDKAVADAQRAAAVARQRVSTALIAANQLVTKAHRLSKAAQIECERRGT